MFRRLSGSALRVAAAARHYTPSEDLKKLYSSEFDKGEFPLTIAPSDSVLFAKFLYKAADSKRSLDVVLKDFQTIAAAAPNLPVFWERTMAVGDIPEFKKLSEPTMFTLRWMQSNNMLDLLPNVAEVYETYANAKQKRVVAKVYVPVGKDGDALVAEGQKVAQQLLKDAPELAGYSLMIKKVVDPTIESGYAVDLVGRYANFATGGEAAETRAAEVDYTAFPAAKVSKTMWEENVETEMLRKYLDSLSLFDEEEAKNGV